MSERQGHDPGLLVRAAVVAAVLVPVFGGLIWALFALNGPRQEPSIPPPARIVKRTDPLAVTWAPTLTDPKRLEAALSAPEIFPETGELHQIDTMSFENSAAAALKMSRLSDALTPLKRLVRLEPENPTRWTDLGEVIERSGDHGLAIDIYRQALELEPNHASANYHLGVLYLSDAASVADALKCLKKAESSESDEVTRKRIQLHIRTAESLLRNGTSPR